MSGLEVQAQQSLKDQYLFDFVTLREGAVERDLERGSIEELERKLTGTFHTRSQPGGHKPLLHTAYS